MRFLRSVKLGVAIGIAAMVGACGNSGTEQATVVDPLSIPVAQWNSAWATALTQASGTTVTDTSYRMVVRMHTNGSTLRIKLSNVHGANPLNIQNVSVAVRTSGGNVDVATLKPLTFNGGKNDLTIPKGQTAFSDAIDFDVVAEKDIAVTIQVKGAVTPDEHLAAFSTQYVGADGAGDLTKEATATKFTKSIVSFWSLSQIDVMSKDIVGTLVTVGSSSFDGSGSNGNGIACGTNNAVPVICTYDEHNSMVELTGKRLGTDLPAGQRIAVANAGFNGDTVTGVIDRLERDVFSRSGVKYVFLYAGQNDIRNAQTDTTGDAEIANIKKLSGLVKDKGLKFYVSTINPNDSFTPIQNMARQKINQFIKFGGNCSGFCEAIFDLDAVLAWSVNPNQYDPMLNSGDTIHANAEGHKRVADYIFSLSRHFK